MRVILSPRNLRLVRRLVRDYHFRATGPEKTLKAGGAGCRGEICLFSLLSVPVTLHGKFYSYLRTLCALS